MNLPVDLRSDTVTRPCPNMRQAMARAEVGDDVIGDDPTLNRLERIAAEMLGMEASLFVPSGTMGNQLAIFTHTNRSNEVICGRPCHIQEHEVGAAALISAVTLVSLNAPWGELEPSEVELAIREPDIHHPETGLICLECAHSSGAIPAMENLEEVAETARKHSIPIHIDGARIFNASIALGIDPSKIAALADSVMFCLSKGLGAPVGSLLCGTKDFIQKARKGRKLLGGGMRQAGVLAAAGIYALEKNINRLAEDHERADAMAGVLSKIDSVEVLSRGSEINMVWLKQKKQDKPPMEIVEELEKRNVLVYPPLHGLWRLVLHKDIKDESFEYACRQLEEVLS